jgi:hypothetical protein
MSKMEENAMKVIKRVTTSGWSFVAGMLFGAFLVFARMGPSIVTRMSGHASPHGALDVSARAASVSQALDAKEVKAEPSPAIPVGAKSHSKTTPSRGVRHSECELQLD